jgi:hypothetical protein
MGRPHQILNLFSFHESMSCLLSADARLECNCLSRRLHTVVLNLESRGWFSLDTSLGAAWNLPDSTATRMRRTYRALIVSCTPCIYFIGS